MNNFITKMMCMVLMMALCLGGLSAQTTKGGPSKMEQERQLSEAAFQQEIGGLSMPNQDAAAFGVAKIDERPASKANMDLGYAQGTIVGTYTGYSLAASTTTYISACMDFTAEQVSNYVGCSLNSIEVNVAPELSGTTPLMSNWTSFRVWIKTALDGAVVYSQDITTPTLGAWNTFTLTTPYTITAAPLVIGYTIGFTMPATAAYRYPITVETASAPYPTSAYNIMQSTNIGGHGTGAAWGQTAARAALIWGHVSGTPTFNNDLSAIGLLYGAVKWVGGSSAFTVQVFNGGGASQSSYSIQLLDASNNVLATQAYTTAIGAGKYASRTVNYTPTAAGNLAVKGKVLLTGDQKTSNDVSAAITNEVFAYQPMAYCTYLSDGAYGATSNPNTVHATIGYLAADMTPFIGKQLTSMKICLPVEPSTLTNCSIWIRNSTTGTNLYTQNFTPTVNGWNTITLTTPYPLQSANTYIGYTLGTVVTTYPLSYSMFVPANTNGGHFAIGTTWYTLAAQNVVGNMDIIGVVAPATTAVITTASSPVAGGTTTGGGTFAIGANVTLTATPNSGYTFQSWNMGTTVLSTNNPYTFPAATSGTYTAKFVSTSGVTCDDQPIVIGTTNNQYGPTCNTWEYCYCQQIYDATEIGYAGQNATITKIAYNYIYTTPYVQPYSIYMCNTTKSEFTAAALTEFVPLSQMQLVYQGTPTFSNANTWSEIEFDTPFEYTGGNIVIAAVHNSGYYNSYSKWTGGTTTQYRNIYNYNMSNPVVPENPTGSVLRQQYRPNVRFEVCTGSTTPSVTCVGVACNNTTTSSYQDPLPGWWGWSRNIMLFEATELGGIASEITELAFNIASPNTNTSTNRTMKIYLLPTTATTLNTTYAWNTIKAGATLVYEATPGINFPTAGWQTFVLNAPFAYDGTQNLLVLVEGTGCTTSGGCAATCYFSTKTNCHWYSRKDTTPPDDNAAIGTRNSDRPNIKFTICAAIDPCNNPPSNLQVNYQNSCAQAVLTWNAPASGPHVYNIYRDSNPIASNVTVETFTDLTFDQYAGHTWEVRVVCGLGTESTGVTATKTKCNESTCAPKIVGTGTSGDYDPLPGYYAFNRDIMLYEASELGGAGTIMDISYNISSTNATVSTNRTMKIYMMQTDATIVESTYTWNTIKTQATLVYEATPGINFPTAGWQTFTLTTPFFCDGTQNLLILVEGTGCTTSGGCSAQCYYTTKTNSHWRSRKDTTPPNDDAPAGERNSSRANVKFMICEGTLDPCEDMASNLQVAYANECGEAVLTWDAPAGGSGVPGTITTPNTSNNGSGAVAFDVIAGAQPVTITAFETPFTNAGAATVHVYYRSGTACGFAGNSAGWTLVGQTNVTVTATGNGNNTYVEMPAPLTVPAGQTYGLYIGTFGPSGTPGAVRYYTGSTTCAATTVATNSHLTIKGGHGITTPTAPFGGSINTERNFCGTIHYTTPSGKGKSMPEPIAPPKAIIVDPASLKDVSPEERAAAQEIAEASITMPVATPEPFGKGGSKAVVLNESFATSTLPTGWTTLDVDGDGHTWKFTQTAQDCSTIYPEGHGGTGDYCINSASYYNCVNALTPNNWLITPTLNLDGSSQVTYWIKAVDAAYYAEHYGVYVTTTGSTNPTDYTLLFEETLTSAAAAGWLQRTVNIPQTGTNCRIAFRHFNSYDIYIMLLDDIVVTTGGTPPPPPGDYTYNIYRDGVKINTALVQTETYTDITFDQYEGHEWEVRVVCDMGIESEGIFASKDKCNPSPCKPHIIGSGTTGSYQVPVNFYYRHSYTQEIYTAEELGNPEEGSTILSVAFQYIKTAAETRSNQTYYIGFTDKTAFGSTSDWIPLADLTAVTATKTITYNNSNTWFVIEFDTPIEYLGGNLVVAVLNNHGDYTNNTNAWNLHAATGNKTLHYYVDGSTQINPASPPAGNLLTNRANANFHICGFGDCDPVENLTAKYNLFCTKATLEWEYEGFGKSAGFGKMPSFGGNTRQQMDSPAKAEMTEGGKEGSFALTAATRDPNSVSNPSVVSPGKSLTSYADAYVFHGAGAAYSSINLATGALTYVAPESSDPYPTGEDFDGTNIYRLLEYGQVLKVNENGTTTTIGTLTGFTQYAIGWAYDWVGDGSYYYVDLTGASAPFTQKLYKVTMPSLTQTVVGTITPGSTGSIVRGLTIGADGFIYALENSSSGSSLLKINKTNAQTTVIGSIGFASWYGMDMAFDRQTNTLYATPYSSPNVRFGTINISTGAWTQISTTSGQHGTLVITKPHNLALAKAPDPFTVTAVGTLLKANLAWTNPTQTLAGNPLTSIQKIVLKRDSDIIQEFTTVSPGQNMTFTDNNVPSAGNHCYSAYAVTSEGNGASASDCDLFGDMCNLSFEMWDYYGDGWNNGTITVKVDGSTLGTVTLGSGNAYGTTSIVIPSGALELLWTPGSYDCECEFAVYNADAVEIYHSPTNGSYPCGTPGVGMYGVSGSFFTTTYDCGGEAVPIFKIYRDGGELDTTTELTYEDETFDPWEGHEWKVTVICPDGYESKPIKVSLGKCSGECEAPSDLTGEYAADCSNIVLNWVAPTTVGKKIMGMTEDPGNMPPKPTYTKPEIPVDYTRHRLGNIQTAPNNTPSVQLLGGAKGNTARAHKHYPEPYAYIGFDVDNITGYTTITSTIPTLYGGECVDGILYAHDENNVFYKIDTETGAVISQMNPPSGTLWFQDMAYDYSSSTMYGVKDNALWTINLNTGGRTQVAPLSYTSGIMFTFAINLAGNAYGVGADGNFYSINKTSGQCTVVGSTGQSDVGYAQSMAFDHYTGTLYWAHSGASSDWWRTINVTTGQATFLANAYEMTSLHIPYIADQTIAKAPAPFMAIPIAAGDLLACKLDWTNPTETLGGEALTSIDKIVVTRNGGTIKEYPGAGVGAVMTYLDEDVPSTGSYTYAVYAVTSAGDGAKASKTVLIGNFCDVTFEMFDSYGDGWNGNAAIEITVDGDPYGTAKLASGSYGVKNVTVPSGVLSLKWIAGTWDAECSFKVYNAAGDLIYTSPSGMGSMGGVTFYTDDYVCPVSFDFTYNVYRDGELLGTTLETTWTDSPIPQYWDHTWCVRVACLGGGESEPTCIKLPGCMGDCPPVENLEAQYLTVNCEALLTWDEPDPLYQKSQTGLQGPKPVIANVQKSTENMHRQSNGTIKTTTPTIEKPILSPAPKGMINVTLEAHDVWGDNTGFQLLLDQTATEYGVTIPATGATIGSFGGTTCAVPANLYDVFSHKNPLNANPVCTTTNMVYDGSVTIQIPAGVYDWGIANPCPGDRIWRVGAGGGDQTSGARDNYLFEEGYSYHFLLQLYSSGNDGVEITKEVSGELCDPVTNVTAKASGSKVTLNWTGVAGAIGYEVLFNGTSLETVTTTTYTHVGVPIGIHTYSVKAIMPGDCIPIAAYAAPVTVGQFCNITFEMWDEWGDGWDGAAGVIVKVDGVTWGTAKLSGGDYGTQSIMIPNGELTLTWNTGGSYDYECSFVVYDKDDNEIYASPEGMGGMGGVVLFTTDWDCGGVKYKVYRDGELIASHLLETEYIDYDLDPLVEHEWCVTMMCDEERESPERCVSLRACGICYPVENLISVQPSEGVVQFCWTDPADIPGFLGVKIIRDGVIIAPLVALPNLCYTDYVSVGNHLYCFVAMYDKYECSESPAVCHNIYIYPQCDPVTDVTATVQSTNNVKVTWTLSNALGVIDYSVYRDGLAPSNLLGNTTQMFYLDQGVEPGSHEYCIIVNYNKLPECSASVPACATVLVETCAMVETVTVTSATKESITITWTLSTGVDDVTTFKIYRNSALIATVEDETTYTDEGTFTEGATYIYCVVPAYTTCQVTPKCAEAYIEPCVPIDVTNVVATGNQTAKTAYITWTYTGTDATFDILKDGKFLTNTAQKNYTDNIEYDVIYKYCIYPVAECAGGKSACDTVVIKTPDDPPAIDELSGEVSIYPNPANTNVVIKGKDVVQVDIYNVVGQIVESIKSAEGEYISKIDVSAYTSGAYVFKIYTSDKAVVNKPIVIRH